MSLLTNPYVRTLWDSVLTAPDEINPSRVFWHYVLSKTFFAELPYCLPCFYTPTSPQLLEEMHGICRLNVVVQYIASDPIDIICVVESGSPNDAIGVIEHRALDACDQHLRNHGLSFIYAMTTVGTQAKLWKYTPRAGMQPQLEPLFPSPTYSYIEADAPAAYLLELGFFLMKSDRPH